MAIEVPRSDEKFSIEIGDTCFSGFAAQVEMRREPICYSGMRLDDTKHYVDHGTRLSFDMVIADDPWIITTKPILGIVQNETNARMQAAEKLPVLVLQDIVLRKLKNRRSGS